MIGTHQPLRIAHVITRLINGGADENTVISCNQAVRYGHSVVLVHGAQTRREILAAVDARVEIVELRSLVQPIAPLSDIRALGDLVRIFRRYRPEVVHTHTSKAGILGRLAARASSVPVLVHTLLDDPARCAELARGAAATELSEWDATRMGERIEAVYAAVIRERMPQRMPRRREAVT
jgi:glycosyl transferase family 4